MRYPGGKAKALTLSFDDGVDTDARLIDIMNKHGLKGTFNINSGLFTEEGYVYPEGAYHRRMSRSKAYELYSSSGQEIAAHGYTHPYYVYMPTASVTKDILDDRSAIENMFRRIVRGFAYPYGEYNDGIIEALKASGIAYARTVHSTGGFELPEDWLKLAPTCHYADPQLPELTKHFIELKPCQHWKSVMFYLWGHSYEFEQHDNWSVIEKFAQEIGGKDDIWYATNIEIYDYVAAYNHLQFSADYTMSYNGSVIDLWIAAEDRIIKIGAGETVRIQ